MAYSDNKIHGLIDGIVYYHHERVDELNDRISQRLQSDVPLQPLYNPRLAMTKYAVFPMLDIRNPSVPTSIDSYLDYSTETSFAPIQSKGPVDAYIKHIDNESNLRNQYFAISSAPQSVYVPSSDSDLYRNRPVAGSINEEQPYPYLFADSVFDSSLHPNIAANPSVGSLMFFNDTRAQLRGDGYIR